MPIYEYNCKECGKDFETLVLGKDIPSCPFCKSENLSRLLSACGFKTAGSGSKTDPSSQGSSFSSSSACSGCTATSCSTCGSA